MKLLERQKIIKGCSGIVIKVGTRLLTDTRRIEPLARQLAELRKKCARVLLVSSGAVGLGMKTLGMTSRPGKLSEIQALAAIGQSKLMSLYEKECGRYGFHAAQLLLTASDINDRERHLNVMNCINSLWAMGILPVVNENDSVSVDELKFGDNDCLAALLAVMLKCELTVILTTVDGLHSTKDGKLDQRISIVSNLGEDIRKMAQNTDDSNFSTGGMASKLKAAELVNAAGESLWIADGRDEHAIDKILAGEDVGTIFTPSTKKQMQSKKRWLNFFSKISGKIIVDAGASIAILEKGRSLLPSGICGTEGRFLRGETVNIVRNDGTVIAKGLSNYSSDEIAKIAGRKTSEISSLIGYQGDDEVVHRDNLVLKS